jgi:hypothetical protein
MYTAGVVWISGRPLKLTIEFYKANGTLLGSVSSPIFSTPGRHVITAVAPPLTVAGGLFIQMQTDTIGQTTVLDAVSFHEGPDIGYFDGDFRGYWRGPTHNSTSAFQLQAGEEMYNMYTPLIEQYGDEGEHLKTFQHSFGALFRPLENLVRDQGKHPGYSQILDLSRVRPEWMRWLGQFVGYFVPEQSSNWEIERSRISSHSAHRRGSVPMLRDVILEHLAPGAQVIIRERVDGFPHRIAVYVYTADIITTFAALSADAQANKAAGLIMTVTQLAGAQWNTLVAASATWNVVVGKFADWNEVIVNPGKP